ncbi:MAG: hypothetical protein NVS9B14_14070 [Candidatus Acidiferrum sp.]
MTSLGPFDWNRLLPERNIARFPDSVAAFHAGKTVLVTGAGGSIGSALVRSIAVYHSAAFKHVPLMEANPFAAIRNNALATWHLAQLAVEHQIPRLLLISTDKAANPRSIMGASKRLAELAMLRWNSPRTRCSAIRLGNVLGSHGSVVPLFLRQIEQGRNLTVAHREVSRYFLTMDETVQFIFGVAALAANGGLYLPEMGEPIKIHSLATRLLELASPNGLGKPVIEFTGLRPGDKLTEDLVSSEESLESMPQPGLYQIAGAPISSQALDTAFDAIGIHTRSRDLSALLDAIRKIVPEYEPSADLLQSAAPAATNFSSHA